MNFEKGDYVGQVVYRYIDGAWVLDSVVVMPSDEIHYNATLRLWQQVRGNRILAEWEDNKFIVPIRFNNNRPLTKQEAEALDKEPKLSWADLEVVRKLVDG